MDATSNPIDTPLEALRLALQIFPAAAPAGFPPSPPEVTPGGASNPAPGTRFAVAFNGTAGDFNTIGLATHIAATVAATNRRHGTAFTVGDVVLSRDEQGLVVASVTVP
jgi:hypothetical protein